MISILLSIILIFSTSIYVIAEGGVLITDNHSRGISLLANYHTETLDKGLLYINEYNQELLIKRTDVSTFENGSQFDIVWYYSSINNEYEDSSPYGLGWKTNYDIRLKYEQKLNQFVYLHDDGAVVSFNKTNQNLGEYTYWEEDISVMCRLDELYVKTGSTSPADAYIKTFKDEILRFNDEGKIVSIEKNNQTINIAYNDFGISSIVDPSGRTIIFSYNLDNLVSEIAVYDNNKNIIHIESNGIKIPYKITYTYTSNNELETVQFPGKDTITYKYSNKNLSIIKGFDGVQYLISYNNERVEALNQCSGSKRRNIVSYSVNGNCLTKHTTFGSKSYTCNKYGLVEMNKEYKNDLLKETKQMVLGDEVATKERVLRCTCKDCKIVNCNCLCDNSDACKCFTCNISSKIDTDNASYKTIDYHSTNNENELGLIKEETVGSNAVYNYEYDYNLNLTKISIELSKLTDSIIENNYKYEDGKLVFVSNQNTEYDLSYDIWGNANGFSIGVDDNIKYEYLNGDSSYIDTISYGNSQIIDYEYQEDGKLSKVYCNKNLIFSYNYFLDDSINIINYTNSTITSLKGDKYSITEVYGNELFSIIDSDSNRAYTLCIGNNSYDIAWQYVKDKDTYSLQCITNGANVSAVVDVISDYNDNNRVTIVSDNDKNAIGYKSKKVNANNETNEILDVFLNTYDNNIKHWETLSTENKIDKIYLDEQVYSSYKYDELGELIYSKNGLMNYIEEFTYDNSGNLTTRKSISSTSKNKVHIYKYEDLLWGDKLTAFDDSVIEYDSIGNPLKYGNTSYSWSNGRILESVTNDRYSVKFEYDSTGLRISKTVYDIKTLSPLYKYRYYWGNGILVGYDYTNFTDDTYHTVTYILDNSGFNYGYIVDDKDIYIYERNPLNEIVAIWHNGKQVSAYSYSAFGEIISNNDMVDLNSLNILFYKDYIYDEELNMYYLQSRYYVPEWGRFLNADIYIDTGTGILGTNMFAYCENDPVNYVDPSGFWKINNDDNSHDKLTELLYEGENYAYLEDMVAANVSIDEEYSAVVPTNANQKYHFDRQNYISGSSGDTRGEMAAVWLEYAMDCYTNTRTEAIYIGKALHSMQDVTSHGNIGLHQLFAAHGTHEDDREYIWKDDTRGENTLPFFSSVKKTTGEQTRWIEAQAASALTFVLYAILRAT